MKAIVFSFHNVTHDSMIASNKIARFVSEELDLPIVCDESIERYGADLDVLLIVNGAYAFCKYLDKTQRAIQCAKEVVWIQNDYTIIPPKAESGAESPFRKAFREREMARKPRIAYWSTVRDTATMGTRSSYVNWNSLTFDESVTEADVKKWRAEANGSVLYYGAFRTGRRKYFDRYFLQPKCPIAISDPGRTSKFEQHYKDPMIHHLGKIPGALSPFLGSHRLGLYLEDKTSHNTFCSPANRFYEMLSAGLPMVFQPECGSMMRKAGFDPEPYYVRNSKELATAAESSENILWRQRAAWIPSYGEGGKSFRKLLREQLQAAWKRTQESVR